MTPPASDENVSGPSPSAARDSRRRLTVDPAETVDPAPRDSQRLPHDLPLELSSFVGREREMGEIERLLAETRLLTLTGPGGSGKTRLALRAVCTTVDRLRCSAHESLFDGSEGEGACRRRPRHAQKGDSPHPGCLRAYDKALFEAQEGNGIGGTQARSQACLLNRPARRAKEGLVEDRKSVV